MTIPIVYHGLGIRYVHWSAGRNMALMRAIARRHPVVVLDSPDLAGGAFRRHRPRIEPIHENLTVVRNAFGWRAGKIGKRLDPVSAYVDARWVRSALLRLGARDYVFWMGSPGPSRTRWLNTSRLVFDCLDPCFDKRFQAEFDRSEAAIASRSRVVFATAQSLLERMKRLNPNTYHLPNATHPEFAGEDGSYPTPAPLKDRPRPIVGYMGTLDGRFDFESVAATARAYPHFTFALVGRLNGDQVARAALLKELPNVVMPGEASEETALAYNLAFDVGLIPFTREPDHDALDPVKLYMYLLTGKPVVAAATRECRSRGDLIYLAQSQQDWIDAVSSAAVENNPRLRQRRVDYGRANTWDARADTALCVLEQAGLFGERS